MLSGRGGRAPTRPDRGAPLAMFPRASALALERFECQRRPPSNPQPLVKETRAMAKFRPLQDRLLIKRVEEENKTRGGIIIPETAKEKPLEGKVVAVGNG